MLAKKILFRNWGLILVVLLSFWVVKPLFLPGFFPIHDDTQVVRVAQMAKALREGQFPVRWVSDLGYGFGYPIFNFYGPLPYYVGALFNLIGFDPLVATKFMFGIGILLSGVFMYFLAGEFFGKSGGVLAAILYQYAPYHAVDIYIRGAVGEFWAIALLPLVGYGIYKLAQSSKLKVQKFSKYKYLLVGSLGLAVVILSHNVSALLLALILGVCFLILVFATILRSILVKKEKSNLGQFFERLSPFLLMFVLGIGLSAFFWLPALAEVKYTNVEKMIKQESNYAEHFLYLDQLWDSPWGFAGSGPGRLDGMSFKIGKLHLILALFGLIVLIYAWRKGRFRSSLSLFPCFLVSLLIFSIFMTTEYSRFVWETLSFLAYAQYPWRFLVFVIFAVSFLGGVLGLTPHLLTKFRYSGILSIGIIAITFLVILVNAKYFQPQRFLAVAASDYLSEENIKWRTSKISDEYLPADFERPKSKKEIVKEKIVLEEGVELLNKNIKSHIYSFIIEAYKSHNVLVRTAYFPGWEVFVDGKKSNFQLSHGQMLIPLSSGRHKVVVRFTNTRVRTLANLISFFTLTFLFSLIAWTFRLKFNINEAKS